MGIFRLFGRTGRGKRCLLLCVSVLVSTFLSGCAETGEMNSLFSGTDGLGDPRLAAGEGGEQGLDRATAYWAGEYMKDPKNAESAINYSKNLKLQGDKKKALSVLAHSFQVNSREPKIASAYGRLALDMGKLKLAEQILPLAEVPGKPDWRLISAKGTLLAKRGNHKKAQAYFLQALKIKPNQPTVLNNLALAYALDGKPKDAETLLRRAIASQGDNKRLRQNLALVLGLQGRFGEAKQIAGADLKQDVVKENESFMRQMVRVPGNTPVTTGALSSARAKRPSQGAEGAANSYAVKPGAMKPIALAPSPRGIGASQQQVKPQASNKKRRVSSAPSGSEQNAFPGRARPIVRSRSSGSKNKVAVISTPESGRKAGTNARPATMRNGTFDDSFSGWGFDTENRDVAAKAPKT